MTTKKPAPQVVFAGSIVAAVLFGFGGLILLGDPELWMFGAGLMGCAGFMAIRSLQAFGEISPS